jgi:hypothetical protein
MNITLFAPHYGQEKIINNFADSSHKFGIVSCGRQFGKSLLAQNLLLYWLLKTGKQKGAWITPVYNQAKKIFTELTNASHEIITKQNKADLTIEFINGSTIQFLSTDNYNTIRGFSFNYMVLDECAFIREEAINEAILPTLSALGKKCLMISTPKSKNWFYTYYLRGLNEGGDYISFRGISTDNPYVDKNFIIEQRKSLPHQIYLQEYEAEFSEAANDVFSNLDNTCILNEWEQPRSGARYFAGIDFGLQNDFSVLTIVSEDGRVCFIERINGTSYSEITEQFTEHLRRYKITGGYAETNGPGLPVFEMLSKTERNLRGFTTTNDNKNQGIRTLIYDIQEGRLLMPSKQLFPHLYNELNAYSYKIGTNGTISFNAPSGYFDDCVMSLMLANESRTKVVLRKNTLHIGGKKVNEQTKVAWGSNRF